MSKNIRILSFNTHLFKGSLPGTFDPKILYEDTPRANKCLELSNGPFDILGFTEVWADKMREKFINTLSSYKSFSQPSREFYLASPGMVLSVKGQWANTNFSYYKGLIGDDAFSSKGVAFGIAQTNSKIIGILQTHAQATYTGKEKEDRTARDKQILETLIPDVKKVIKILNELKFKAPIILLGDLNIVGGSDEYQWFSDQMSSLGFFDCWTRMHPNNPGITYDPIHNPLVKRWDPTQKTPQRLDYMFLNPMGSGAKCQEMNILIDWKVDVGGNDIFLSDHYPIELIINIP